MFAIYKYPAGYENGKLYYFGKKGKIVRSGWVDDGVYKGYWIWVIVDIEEESYGKYFHLNKKRDSFESLPVQKIVQLGICEEQVVEHFPSLNKGIEVENGFVYLTGSPMVGDKVKSKVVGYKTGQKFNINPDRLQYLGFAPIVIKNEIAIYYFKVNE